MVTKLRAAALATAAGTETLIVGGGGAGLEGARRKVEVRGTRLSSQSPHTSARKSWLAQQRTRGTVEVDAGALRALQTGRSLLPKGITGVSGSFSFGDAVAVIPQWDESSAGAV